MLIGGDFNAKVWKSLNRDCNQDPCLGKHSRRRRNESGQSLADWCNIHIDSFATQRSNILVGT